MTRIQVFPQVVMRIGWVEITTTVVYSGIVTTILVALALVVRSAMSLQAPLAPSRLQMAIELLAGHFEAIVGDMFRRDPRRFTPLIVTLALFIAVSNVLGLVPGLGSPTADLSLTAALATIVFVAVPLLGIRERGLGGYLKHYLEPAPLLLPITIVTELSRTVALAVRLFGNMLSGELVLAVLLAIAGFLVPVPLMLLHVVISLVQAYIFTVLAVVYLAAALRAIEPASSA